MLKLHKNSLYLVEGKLLKLTSIKELRNKTQYMFSNFRQADGAVFDVYNSQQDEIDAFTLMAEPFQVKMMEEGRSLDKTAELIEIQDREITCWVMIEAWEDALARQNESISDFYERHPTMMD